MTTRAAPLLLLIALWSSPGTAVSVGDVVPSLTGQTLDGGTLTLTSLRGHVVYLDFWASWCPPCRLSLPAYERWHQRWHDRGLKVVGVNVDTERAAAFRALRQSPVTFPIVLDPGGLWPSRFEVPAMPTAYLIDRTGVVRHVHEGFRSADVTKLEALIANALRETP